MRSDRSLSGPAFDGRTTRRPRWPRWPWVLLVVVLVVAGLLAVPEVRQQLAHALWRSATEATAGTLERLERERAHAAAQRDAAAVQARIESVRAVGVAVGPQRAHLLVDVDPGPLNQARDHLCSLVRASHGAPLAGRPVTVSVSRPRAGDRLVGEIRCD
ncbi:MAG: hypothetical protein KF823_04020 [Xanthomonadales bacterium]|nr:hypothetical protein [Xanthomonadales bacterium]